MPKRQAQRIIDNRSANRNPTTISGITLTSPGTAYTAGDGLTLTGVVLAVGAGDGVSVAADAVAVDSTVVRTTRTVTAGSGLTGGGALSADLTLNVGAGTLIAVGADSVGITAGSNYQFIGTGSGTAAAWQGLSGLAGNGLTHSAGVLAVGVANTGAVGLSVEADAVRLTSSSNPGAAARVLASTAAGGLTLVSLAVTGAATVGQDFTVGANVLYVNQAGTRVGINRAPDQQFDLDVAGAIRGQYLIGKHAIQLASAVGVWHFDGPAPYNLDFGGSDASHAGVGGTPSGAVIYVPGKFGKAVQVAEATTNLITNPRFEAGLTGWTTSGSTRSTTGGKYGAAYLSAGTFAYTTATLTNGAQYTVSFWHRGAYSINVDYGNGTLNAFSNASAATEADGWGRYTLTFTANGTAFRLFLYTDSYDAVQLEQKAYATPYCDGSLGTGHSWSGTAHASSSSRLNASLIFAGDLLSASAGSIMFWADTGGDPDARASIECGSTTGIWFIFDPGNNQEVYVGSLKFDLSSTIAAGWNHFALSWSAEDDEIILYQNGVQIGTTQTYTAPTLGATLTISGFYGLDELVILDYAADAKLIRAIYESDAPVFVESSVFHWRSPSASPIWVDEYGLWARSVTGNEILGVYGGDPRRTATYRSWGGVNLEDNDVLIGRAAGGYMHWDDSAQTLSVQGTITALAGSIAGVLTIGTSGEIRQGTGTLGSDYTGLRIWRDSGVGRIAGYASNTPQWYAGTDGKLYAGGGNVLLDSDGIALQSAIGSYQNSSALLWYRTLSSKSNLMCSIATWDTADYSFLDFKIFGPLGTAPRMRFYIDSTSMLELNSSGVGINGACQMTSYLEMREMTAPSAPASNRAYLYLDDNGSGKTRLMVRFSSGSAIQLAIQP